MFETSSDFFAMSMPQILTVVYDEFSPKNSCLFQIHQFEILNLDFTLNDKKTKIRIKAISSYRKTSNEAFLQ